MEHDHRVRLEKEKLSDEEVDLLYDIMESTAVILERNGIKYTLEGGSLLGAVRNRGLIPHDNDGDFDVLQCDIPKIKALQEEFAECGLVIVETPGWGLQISWKDSPELKQGLWTNGVEAWTSKWPFLDLIAMKWCDNTGRYVLSEDVAMNDYPNYYITKEEWEMPFEKIRFGHLMLFAIQGEHNRANYLDRNYPNWSTRIEMVMDHRENVYFEEPIRCALQESDKRHRARSNRPSVLTRHLHLQ